LKYLISKSQKRLGDCFTQDLPESNKTGLLNRRFPAVLET
jgi:hypothetical protein